MYTVTSDFKHFLTIDDKKDAMRMADNIKGIVFLVTRDENWLIYSYKDSL